METTQNAEVIELSLVKTIETKLVQANVTEQVLLALKEKYAGMKLAAIDDKESYLEIKQAAKECAKVRTLTVKICKEGREEAVKAQKQWIAKEKEIVGQVAEVEDALDAEIKAFDDNVARLEQEEKNRQEEAYINRQASLTKLGATYSDGSFVLGEASFEAILIKGSSESVWEGDVLPRFQTEYEKIEAVRIAEQKKKDDEAAELKKQQDALAAQQKAFEEQQAAFKKQQKEAAQAEKDRIAAEQKKQQEADDKKFSERMVLLQGWSYNGTFAKGMGNMTYSKPEIINLSDADFGELVKVNHDYIVEQDKIAEDKRLYLSYLFICLVNEGAGVFNLLGKSEITLRMA